MSKLSVIIKGNLQVSMPVGQGHAMTATSSGRRVFVQSWSGSIQTLQMVCC
ncbi:hypothetical protein DPMN_110130 [Dreissena polymorpha]|uniref:Uncharacterized protein n=1 Tax=Dreissena polymorpha TaxID=45954 RepID=A0A9D4KC19_DREPO|nr:hypothetical protein DPMN_110130 [Dreissena polymorpha]